MTKTSTGSCLCGSIQFSVSTKPIVTMVCYCEDCRKGSGHLGQILAKYDTKDIEITDKDSTMKEYIVTKTQSGFPKKKFFCGNCGCTIHTQPTKFNGEITIIRTTLLDENFGQFVPSKGIFVDAKKSFVEGTECEYY
ncbi:Mss4-like protein [Scheffersomyces xylosifermentans]|uniref:Mss4-like protein n=1 Tax=Scheffersomyces xylosifermentans TaxID=1304137 RepID=UPI00315CE4A2